MNIQKYMVIIVGPTGVGKTEIAEQLATHIPSEIVNLDMGQCYTPLTIGTAKPDWKLSPITQHLFDSIDEPRNTTVVQYRATLLKTLHDIWSRNKLPILVGGSSFYLKSIFYPPSSDGDKQMPPRDEGIDGWSALNAIDPKRAAMLHPKDTYRINRALDIWYATGQKPSEFQQVFTPPSSFLIVFLTRDRQELYDRINRRVQDMMEQGWLQEAQTLKGTAWEPFLKEKKIIGYNELFSYLDQKEGERNLHEVIGIIQQRTRNYAKRQYTFWKKLEKQLDHAIKTNPSNEGKRSHIILLNLTCTDLTLYIKQLLKQLAYVTEKF